VVAAAQMDIIEEDEEEERTYSAYKMKRPLFPAKAKLAMPDVEAEPEVGNSTSSKPESVTPIIVEDVEDSE